eukprot:366331-Chlamydomonas_euryale.AAC.3
MAHAQLRYAAMYHTRLVSVRRALDASSLTETRNASHAFSAAACSSRAGCPCCRTNSARGCRS